MHKDHEKEELSAITRSPAEIWMFNRRMTITEAALAAGVSQSSLSRALLPPSEPGFRSASLPLRRKFKRFTEGKVDIGDWPEPIETPIGEPASPPAGDRQSTSEGATSAQPSEAFSHT
jgi:hypothetical protein